ncbi:ApeA N-terminal domain 1-containing protein [Enterococcus gallinarum]|uniref:ApeA N-terminal domain 1-containing protein n=1 Tax=Enterococcus gallinarum TaxID=1353 RepID=UPI002433855E|nr:HEPN domain-containing protein [Enterococcus gallinarum]MDV7787748.1 hypothetical protein [Enterococcus gallinarum]
MVKLTHPTMFDNFEIAGIWSLTDKFEKHSVGILTYTATKNYELKLKLTDTAINQLIEIPVIYGISSNSERITLLSNRVIKSNVGAFSSVTISIEKAIIGPKFFKEGDERGIKKVSFGFYKLNEWMNLPVWNHDYDPSEDLYTIWHKKFPLREYRIDNIEGFIGENYVFNQNFSVENTNISIPIENFYTLSFDHEKKLDEVYRCINKIVQFFYVLFGSELPLKFIEFEYGQTKIGDREFADKYRVYIRQIAKVQPEKTRTYELFSYNTIAENLSCYLTNWFSFYSDLETIVKTYVGDLQITSFIETQFLNACRNVEIFHRLYLEKKKVESLEIESMRTKLLEIIGDEEKSVKEYFSERITHTGEETLSIRIKESLAIVPDAILKEAIIYNSRSLSKSKNRFVRACVNTRNFLTHGSQDKSRYQPLFEKENLYIVTKVLSTITRYFILNRIKIDSEILEEKILEDMKRKGITGNKLS